MTVRSGILAILVSVASASVCIAQPAGRGIEGRESDPIARDFHQAQPATFDYGGPLSPIARTGSAPSAAGWWVAIAVWDLVLDRLTVPLGTVPMLPGVWD
jgi:hypothetical protein